MFSYLRNLISQQRGKPAAAARPRSISLRLEALEDRLTPSSFATTSGLAATLPVSSGTYFFNPFQVSGTTLNVYGSSPSDNFHFTAGSTSDTVSLNGMNYSFAPGQITTVNLYGVGGTAGLVDSVNHATATLSPHSATLSGPNYTVNTYNMFSNGVFGRAGDTATFYDSTGNDTFSASPSLAWMWDSGNTYLNEAGGFTINNAYSTHGGQDQALFYDSPGNDVFVANPLSASMYNTSNTYRNNATGFVSNQGYSYSGGHDVAYLYDANGGGGNLTANGSYVTLSGRIYDNSTSGFADVEAYSSGSVFSPDIYTLGDNTSYLHLHGWWASSFDSGDPSYF